MQQPYIVPPCEREVVYVVDEKRVVGYDNHERQGDHIHFRGEEIEPYQFESKYEAFSRFSRARSPL